MKNKGIKVLFVFGTRPEAIKMAPVIQEMRSQGSRFKVVVCVTAQHREMLDQVLELFGIEPEHDLDLMTNDQALPNLTARVLLGVTEVLNKENPDIVFVQGDTTTTFAAAQAAFYLKIPVAHIEAGLRTYNKHSPFPEEANRCLTSVLSDFHFAPTETAKKNLIAEGFKESLIFVTGNTVIDALMTIIEQQKDEKRQKEYAEYFRKKWGLDFCHQTDQSRVILVTGHRRESFGEGFKRICEALRILAENNPDVQIVYPVHLNPNVKGPVHSILGDIDNIHLISPLDYDPFIYLMSQSCLILTDSGGIQEEAPTLGIPALIMRDTTERMEGVEAGSSKLVGTDIQVIISKTQELLDDEEEYQRVSNITNPYGDGKASQRIVNIISENLGRS